VPLVIESRVAESVKEQLVTKNVLMELGRPVVKCAVGGAIDERFGIAVAMRLRCHLNQCGKPRRVFCGGAIVIFMLPCLYTITAQ